MSQKHDYRLPSHDRLRPTSSSSSAAIKRPQEIAYFSYIPHTPLPSNAPDPSNLRHYGSTLDPSLTDHLPTDIRGHTQHNGAESSDTARNGVEYSNAHSRSRVLHHDARAIKYYYRPQIGANLSDGFETFQQLDDAEDEHLDGLLACVSHMEQTRRARKNIGEGGGLTEEGHDGIYDDREGDGADGDGAEKGQDWKVKPDLMTWRGMMTRIMSAPYSNFDGFEMNATLFDGTIYIEESHTAKLASRARQAAQKQPPRPGQPSQELMSYWGYKFETLCMLPDTWDATSREYIETRPKHVVKNYEQYISVVQTGVGNLSLVLGGEVDGVWDGLPEGHNELMQPRSQATDEDVGKAASGAPERPNYIELKTAAEHEYLPIYPGSPHQPSQPIAPTSLTRFNRKLLKFWIQSFLLGIPKIIVGFRTNDADGRLVRVEEFSTTAIPRMVRESVAMHHSGHGAGGERGGYDGREEVRGRGAKSVEQAWEKDVCINFARDFLTFVKDVIHKDSTARGGADGGVWKIRRVDRSPVIEVFKVEETGYGDILSREFVEWRTSGDALRAAREGALDRLHRDVWAD